MKATGIVRRIDDLGRVVIPKEIRRTMRIREGDPLEIYTDADGEVIFKKYSPMGELAQFSAQYCEVLSRAANLPILITDRDHVVTCSGISKKDTIERRVSDELEALMESRSIYIASANEKRSMTAMRGSERKVAVAYPIIGGGDVSGSVVMLFGENEEQYPNPTDIKLTQVAATFLGKQTEE